MPPAATTTTDNTFAWLLAWSVMIVMLVLINKTRLGHVIIYYALWLMLAFLIVTQYQAIANLLKPLGQPTS
jgi:predicted aspartyl protease